MLKVFLSCFVLVVGIAVVGDVDDALFVVVVGGGGVVDGVVVDLGALLVSLFTQLHLQLHMHKWSFLRNGLCKFPSTPTQPILEVASFLSTPRETILPPSTSEPPSEPSYAGPRDHWARPRCTPTASPMASRRSLTYADLEKAAFTK